MPEPSWPRRKKKSASTKTAIAERCRPIYRVNLQILAGKQSQLQNEQDALNQAKQRRAYLESALNQYNTVAATIKPGETPVGLPALDQELQRLKAQLSDLSARYTDQHPDVRKLKEQIASTQKMRDQLLAQLKNKPENPYGCSATIQPPAHRSLKYAAS